MKNVIFFLFFFANVAWGSDNTVLKLNSAEGVSAKILLKDNDSLSVSVLDNCNILSAEDMDISSEKKNHITFEDYNRDGYKDFSVWHLDKGMGSYRIYRLFIFAPTTINLKRSSLDAGMILLTFELMAEV